MRLITTGCSLTYGQWMPDNSIFDPAIKTTRNQLNKPHAHYKDAGYPSNQSWPSYLAGLLDCEVVNLAKPGASNKEIWMQAITHDYLPGDIFISLWTNGDRWCVYRESRSHIRIHPTNAEHNPHSGAYYQYIHNTYDSRIDLLMRYNYVYYYLERRGVPQYHFTNRAYNFKPEMLSWSDAPEFPDLTLKHVRECYPHSTALDEMHPGSQVYSEFANQIYLRIKDELP